MSHVLAIARVTYFEAVRNRVLYSLLFFAAALLLVSGIFDGMTTGQQGRVILDLGLTGVRGFGILIAIFLGVSLISREIARKTLYVVLAKPVGRSTFLLGKYLGLLFTLAILVGVMGVLLAGSVVFFGGTVGGPLLHALVMIWVELAVVSAVALVFAVFSGPFLSGMFTLGVCGIGHLSGGLKALGVASGDTLTVAMTTLIYYLMPDLERFNFQPHALYGVAVPIEVSALSLLYAAAYAVLMLVLAAWLFERRDFH